MKRANRLFITVICGTVPLLLWARSEGPPPFSDGGPGGPGGDGCASCHIGTAVGTGVELKFPAGLNYVPGQKQRVQVVITDNASTVRGYGFQASARLASNLLMGQAGTFTPLTEATWVQCQDGARRSGDSCPTTLPVEFIQHSAPSTTNTFEFDWTPPSTNVGEVRFHVGANAANLNGQSTGDRIHLASYTLTPQASSPLPSIASTGGVVEGAGFTPGAVAGSWTTIYGTNLSTSTRDWTGAIGGDGTLPTSLDGVSVTVDGKAAYIYYISPGQINFQTPDLGGKTGPVQVVAKNSAGESAPVSVNIARQQPGLFLFTQSPTKYPAVVRSDGANIGPSGLFGSAVTTVPAKPGDVLLFFGTGFGPTNPAVAPGTAFSGAAGLVDKVQMRIGGISVTPSFEGLSGAGLYQFNVTVPDLPNGEHVIEMQQNSVSIQSNVILAVQR